MKLKITPWLLACVFVLSCKSKTSYTTWSAYGGNNARNHYSALRQIDTSNVASLKPVWIYHTGDADSSTQIQVNPIIIDSTLDGVSRKLRLFALNAPTG